MFFRPGRSSNVVLIFDIGSGSIGGAFVELAEGVKPKIIYGVREPITARLKPDSKRLLDGKKSALRGVLGRLMSNGLPFVRAALDRHHFHPRNAICFLSSPWYVSKTSIIKEEYPDKPAIVSLPHLEEILRNEISNFGQSILKDELHEPVDVIDSRLVDVKLNGYRTSDVRLKKASSFEFSIFLSAAPKRLISSATSLIRESAGARSVVFHSFVLPYFAVIRDLFGHLTDFIFLDVTAEVTDLSVVKDGVLLETISFPIGRNAVIRGIAKAFDVSLDIAGSFLRIKTTRAADKNFDEKIREVIAQTEKEWLEIFRSTLAAINESVIVPRQIFLTLDADVAPFFKGWLTVETFERFGVSPEHFQVVSIGDDTFAHLCEWSPKAFHDPFLAIESLFVSKISSLPY